MNVKLIAVIAILLTLFGISLSYATLSRVIETTSTASVRAANWDVRIKNLSEPVLSGETVINTPPTIVNNTTALNGLDVRFNQVNSSVTYYFEIANEGDLNAKIGTLNISTPVCSTSTTTGGDVIVLEDKTRVCNGLTFTLNYVGTPTVPVAQDDELLKGETKRVELKIEYNDTRLPINEVTIDNLDISINYIQFD